MKRLFAFLFVVFMISALAGGTAFASDAQSSPRIKSKNGASTNWSGYVAETSLASPQANAVSDVKGQWTVTSVTGGTTNTYSSTWVGIDGYSDGTVEQIGVEEDWRNGAPSYYAWYEMYPKFPTVIKTVAVHPGDVISAEVNYTGNSRFTLSIVNSTTGQSFRTVQKARAQRSSAEWIAEAPSSSQGVLPLAAFGTMNFTAASATISGHTGPINDPAWQSDFINMVSASGVLKASTSALSTDGTGFGVTWVSS